MAQARPAHVAAVLERCCATGSASALAAALRFAATRRGVVLTLAFAVRATVALSGDFVLHPDEIMQYLEPAHRLAFGNGVIYWEYFYGARSWLVPGAVAAVLKLFAIVGLGEPFWYVGGVKLLFCALSLASRPACTALRAATSARPRRGWHCWPAPSGTSWPASPTNR